MCGYFVLKDFFFMLYFFLIISKNVGCGPLFTSVHPNIYYRTFVFRRAFFAEILDFFRIYGKITMFGYIIIPQEEKEK